MSKQHYKTIDQCVGGTPLVQLQRLNPNPSNIILAKLEGNNPAFDRDLCSKSFGQEWSLTKHNSPSHKLRADSKVHEEKTHSEVLEEKNHGNYLEENKPTKGQ